MSDLLDVAPTLPRYDAETEGALLQGRRPSLGEFLGASVAEGWWNTTVATGAAVAGAAADGERDARPIAREEWRYSPFWREGVAWDERMTEGRARAVARVYDENRYRRALMQARDPNAFETVLGFGGMLVGSIPDPVNFVPIAGPLVRGLRAGGTAVEAGTMAGRMLAGAARTLDTPGVAGAALRGTVDATGGNILAMPLVYGAQAQFGDEITFDRVVADLAIGALIGAGFGTAGGLIERARTVADQRAAVRVLDAAARDVAAGRPVELPNALVRKATEDALTRSAPPEVAPLLGPAENPLATLPRVDGRPMTREEFGAALAEGGGMASPDDLALTAQRAADEAAQAQTLVRWLVAQGGVRDDGGEIRQALGGTGRTRPGLLNRNGMSPDDAVRRAREAGFFEDYRDGVAPDQVDRLTPNELFAAIDAEMRGEGVRRQGSRRLEAPADRNASERARREAEASLDEAYGWYREALEVERRMRLLPESVRDATMERAAIMEQDGGLTRAEATARAGREAADADPELQAALAQIEAMRAEGRLGAADDAVLRAGDEQAAELEAVANGLEGAAACALRVAA